MIHYLVAERLAFRMEWFLRVEPSLAERLVVLPYERAWTQTSLAPGTYIFSDLEWLSGDGLQATIRLWDRLTDLQPDVTLLNDPSRVLRRYDLLRGLHAQEVNRFNAYRLPASLESSSPLPLRYPVFLRSERAHTGSMSDLLYSWKEVRKALPRVIASGEYGTDELLVVEWCDTSDAAGVFRKYSAFVIGETIVARHLVCSRHWVVKDFGLVDRELLWEARAYVAENPDAEFLRGIARQAEIGWGRFDYAFAEGRPQIWEINTNPIVIAPPRGYDTIDADHLSIELHRAPMRRIATALAALDHASEQISPLAATRRSTLGQPAATNRRKRWQSVGR